MRILLHKTLLFIGLLMAVFSCSNAANETQAEKPAVVEARQSSSLNVSPSAGFNTDSAMAYIERQVAFGPRVPGSKAHALCADWLSATLRTAGATVTDTVVMTTHPTSSAAIPVRNIFARLNPGATGRILVIAHYDTRPWADQDPDPSVHNLPIDGANDGASGVAVALELARNSASLPPDKGLDILFVDMEDSGSYGDDISWCIGSDLWTRFMPYNSSAPPRFGILLDMVGGRDAVFHREYFSEAYAPAVNNLVWKTASRLGLASHFPDAVGGAINDDHLPLLRAGIPVIDIVETTTSGFNPTWHTLSDNLSNIDPETIRAVGTLLTALIF